MDIFLNILFVALFLLAVAALSWWARHDHFATHIRTRYFD